MLPRSTSPGTIERPRHLCIMSHASCLADGRLTIGLRYPTRTRRTRSARPPAAGHLKQLNRISRTRREAGCPPGAIAAKSRSPMAGAQVLDLRTAMRAGGKAARRKYSALYGAREPLRLSVSASTFRRSAVEHAKPPHEMRRVNRAVFGMSGRGNCSALGRGAAVQSARLWRAWCQATSSRSRCTEAEIRSIVLCTVSSFCA
jgi:hypothetical protein